MDWYQKAFGEDYLKVYSHRNVEEANKLVDFASKALQLKPGQKVLDLGSGYGRNAFALAQKNLQVYCLDLSPVLIKIAHDLATENAYPIHCIRADMRNIPALQKFDAIVSFFTSFGYFQKEYDNLRVLKNVTLTLKPGGLFLLDYLNVKHTLFNLVPRDHKTGSGFQITQERSFNQKSERFEKKIIIHEPANFREYHESVRAYGIIEMGSLFAEAGLKCIATYGDYSGKKYSPDSPRLIMIGQKHENSRR